MGYPLGSSEPTVTASLGEGDPEVKDGVTTRKYRLKWLARDWKASFLFLDGSLELGVAAQVLPPKGIVDDVVGSARELCAVLGPPGVPVVGWAGGNDRYEGSFRDWSKSFATIGCKVRDDSLFALVGAATDNCMMLVANAATDVTARVIDRFDGTLLPFDWAHAPHIDDSIDLGAFRYVIDSVVPKPSVGKNSFLRTVAADGAIYVVVRYSIENTGMETATAFANDLVIRDSQGRVFRRASDATRAIAAEERIDVLLSQLQPSVARKQVAVFEVPKVVLDRFDLVIPEKGVLGSGEAVLPFTFREPPKK